MHQEKLQGGVQYLAIYFLMASCSVKASEGQLISPLKASSSMSKSGIILHHLEYTSQLQMFEVSEILPEPSGYAESEDNRQVILHINAPKEEEAKRRVADVAEEGILSEPQNPAVLMAEIDRKHARGDALVYGFTGALLVATGITELWTGMRYSSDRVSDTFKTSDYAGFAVAAGFYGLITGSFACDRVNAHLHSARRWLSISRTGFVLSAQFATGALASAYPQYASAIAATGGTMGVCAGFNFLRNSCRKYMQSTETAAANR